MITIDSLKKGTADLRDAVRCEYKTPVELFEIAYRVDGVRYFAEIGRAHV